MCDVPDEEYFTNIRWLNDLIAQWPVLSNDTAIQIPAVYQLLPEYQRKLENSFSGRLNMEKSSDDAVVLQNLIVFRDKWRTKFEETTEIFYENPYIPSTENLAYSGHLGKSLVPKRNEQATGRRIPYLFQRETPGIKLQENDEFISVVVPFSSDCHMLLSMPKNRTLEEGLREGGFFERALDLNAARPAQVDLYLPSFKIKNKLDLIPVLTDIGAREVFDKYSGQVTKMVNDRFYIESAEQKTEVEVTAEGAFATALTTFRMVKAIGGMGGSLLPRVIKFNHPFLFAIWPSKPTPIPLFIGTFQKPAE